MNEKLLTFKGVTASSSSNRDGSCGVVSETSTSKANRNGVKSGIAQLLLPVLVTKGDPKTTLRLGSLDMSDLITSIEENAFTTHDVPNLQARTEYDNIPDEAVPVIRAWLIEAGSKLHEQARKFLSKFDRDITNSQNKGEGRNRVVVGTYSRIQMLDSHSDRKK